MSAPSITTRFLLPPPRTHTPGLELEVDGLMVLRPLNCGFTILAVLSGPTHRYKGFEPEGSSHADTEEQPQLFTGRTKEIELPQRILGNHMLPSKLRPPCLIWASCPSAM